MSLQGTRFVLTAGTTHTAAIDGISAAGADPDAIVHTPAADAEILAYGAPVRAPAVPGVRLAVSLLPSSPAPSATWRGSTSRWSTAASPNRPVRPPSPWAPAPATTSASRTRSTLHRAPSRRPDSSAGSCPTPNCSSPSRYRAARRRRWASSRRWASRSPSRRACPTTPRTQTRSGRRRPRRQFTGAGRRQR